MAMWMSFLSHLVAVAICARILSATADHVTGGRTRRWLFGYETRALGEPWPDVLGVTVVMVVCAMFMCGLEVSNQNLKTLSPQPLNAYQSVYIMYIFTGEHDVYLYIADSALLIQSILRNRWSY